MQKYVIGFYGYLYRIDGTFFFAYPPRQENRPHAVKVLRSFIKKPNIYY